MKSLFLIFLSSLVTAQTAAINAQILLKSADKPTVYQIISANSNNIKYVKNGKSESLPNKDVKAYYLVDPKKYTIAFKHMASGDYELALDQFQGIAETYKALNLLENNPSTKAAYYAHFCAIQTNQLDQLKALKAKINDKNLIGGEFADKGQSFDFWSNIAEGQLDRLSSKFKSLKIDNYSNNIASELYYIKGLGERYEGNKSEAIEAFSKSIALANTNFTSYERLAIIQLLETLNDTDALSSDDASIFRALGEHYQTFYAEKMALSLPILARLRELGLDV